jgi:RNA polymerase sigma-70 factor (ECF subfamily)
VSADSISIEQAFDIGRSAWPDIDLSRESFSVFAQARTNTWQGNPARAADLYLACACVERIPSAVAEFMSTFGERIPQYLKRLARNPDMVSEVRQVLVTRCIVGDEGHPPALTSYSATGSLEGWLRATAVREALALNRQSDRATGDVEAALEERMPWVDREISLFKQIYREPVSRAFGTACAMLDPQDRALLRLHYVDGVTTGGLATMYKISRATLIRRLADAREALVNGVKTELRAASGVADKDFDSVLRLVHSQIDLRLSMMLRDPD